MKKLSVGTSFDFEFRLTQNDVRRFVQLSGDRNPIHSDPHFAAQSIVAKNCPPGRMCVPGILSACVFSRVLGTIFPGFGTVYLQQTLHFEKPMFVRVPYVAKFKVLKIPARTRVAKISTIIMNKATGEITTRGYAFVHHPNRFLARRSKTRSR